jgi:hypothetical protein
MANVGSLGEMSSVHLFSMASVVSALGFFSATDFGAVGLLGKISCVFPGDASFLGAAGLDFSKPSRFNTPSLFLSFGLFGTLHFFCMPSLFRMPGLFREPSLFSKPSLFRMPGLFGNSDPFSTSGFFGTPSLVLSDDASYFGAAGLGFFDTMSFGFPGTASPLRLLETLSFLHFMCGFFAPGVLCLLTSCGLLQRPSLLLLLATPQLFLASLVLLELLLEILSPLLLLLAALFLTRLSLCLVDQPPLLRFHLSLDLPSFLSALFLGFALCFLVVLGIVLCRRFGGGQRL